jgi:hypothetical protein
VIDEHHARVNPARHALAACDVIGKDRAAQAEIRIVGERDGFVLILYAEEKCDWSEEFLSERGI